ncbi:hypothetical protein [Aureimonas sp. AU22]|uniref:hypothetical protein n=1 Tax=Aureimonas sp. AU22 TaxID=1638162 RepID=UPI00070651BB|nr:hypothetical protein [Aureimonas sp. AU22]BAT30107.1 hypothetical protein [Aureimonas sp. AU22]
MVDDDTPADEPKSERFNMFISKSEMEAIDEWAWRNRIRSKSEAVRRLVQIGIRTERQLPEVVNPFWEATNLATQMRVAIHNVSAEEIAQNPKRATEVATIFVEMYDDMLGALILSSEQLHGMVTELANLSESGTFMTQLKLADEVSFKQFQRLKAHINDFELGRHKRHPELYASPEDYEE